MDSTFTPDQLSELAEAATILRDGAKECEYNHILNGDTPQIREVISQLLTDDGKADFRAQLRSNLTHCLAVEAKIKEHGAKAHFGQY